jgi:hypothetical protein
MVNDRVANYFFWNRHISGVSSFRVWQSTSSNFASFVAMTIKSKLELLDNKKEVNFKP